MTGFAAFSVMKVAVVTCSDGAVVARRLDTAEVHGSIPCRDILGGVDLCFNGAVVARLLYTEKVCGSTPY